MPKTPLLHANERVDRTDLEYVASFGREANKSNIKKMILDQQSRIVEGFRIKLPNQTSYPGRIVVHGGSGFNRDGQLVFTEDQLDITRDIVLEGASTWFYLEVEFIESESDLDARAFWDPTVAQLPQPSGDPSPAGQEFFANVATRKTPDWRIVQPVSTTGFDRDTNPSSLKIPLVRLGTDVANQITPLINTALTTSTSKTVLLDPIIVGATLLRVQDPSLLRGGYQLILGYSLVTQETVTIASGGVNWDTGLATISNTLNAHAPGEILVATGANAPQFIDEQFFGRYRRPYDVTAYDFRDKMFQGDEVHGDILGRGFSSVIARGDLNLRSMKDYVDFLSAQIEELKWGSTNPWEPAISVQRVPPGLLVNLPQYPRYYDRAGGVQGARLAAVTVGDGVNSWGDFNGSTQAALQVAHDILPASGGRIFLKRGVYTLGADFLWTNSGTVTLEGEEGSVIVTSGGRIRISTTGSVSIKAISIVGGTTNIGILVNTSNPADFEMNNILMLDAAFNLNAVLPVTASFRRVRFFGTAAAMAAIPLFAIVGGPASAGTLSGTFTECDFTHLTGFMPCSLIDCISATPTTAMYQANFVDCSFTSAMINFESINLGATSSIVHFDRCTFFGWLTLCHIRATGGGNIKLTNCIGLDAFATLFQGTGVTYVEISGYTNNNPVGLPSVELINCNFAKIRNCNVIVNSAVSLSNCAFKITGNVGGVINQDFLISGNTISGDPATGAGKPTGIIFDQVGSLGCTQIRIVNNVFDANEVGIYFANSGPAANYSDIIVANNNFFDHGTGATAIQKIGMLFGSASSRDNVTINNNVFADFRPGSVSMVSPGVTRAGVWVAGLNNTNFKISNNEIKNIGDSSFLLTDTCGIYLYRGAHINISNNQIYHVYGAGGYGIRIGNAIDSSSITGNTMYEISTYGAGSGIQSSCFGFCSDFVLNTVIGQNQFNQITTSAGGVSASIGTSHNSSASWTNVSINGNNLIGTTVTTYMVYFSGLILGRTSIADNTMVGFSYSFVSILGVAGSSIEDIAITGNSTHGTATCVAINALSSTVGNHISITGNTFHHLTGNSIRVMGITGITITGNTLVSDSANNNILIQQGRMTIVSSNYLFTLDGPIGTACNVHLGHANNVVYTVSGNICDRTGGLLSASILTLGSGNVALGQGLICDNLIKTTPSLNALDAQHDSFVPTFP